MITQILNKIGIDKYMHFSVAAVVAVVLKTLLTLLIPSSWAIGITCVVVVALMIGKELYYDKKLQKGTPEWKDIWAGAVGLLIGIL